MFNANGQPLGNYIDSVLFITENDSLPGAAILVQQNDNVIYTKYFGAADLSNDIGISNETIFNTGSVSKQFTVFAILLLEEKGKLSIQDDIREYIPELYEFEDTITLEQLIRHTSGLKTVNFLALMAGWRQTDLSTHAQMMNLIFRQENLDFAPGTAYKYSNTGAMLLAEVVKRVSGRTFREFMKQEVFDPLEMNNTFVRDDVGDIFKNEAHGYYWENNQLKKAINPHGNIGLTNVYSTVSDLSKWASNFRKTTVGSEEIFNRMESATTLEDGTKVEHAMGQFITPYKGAKQIQHTGGHRAYVAYLGRFPEYNLDIIICSNVEGFDLFGAAYKIADLIIDEKEELKNLTAIGSPNYIKLDEKQLEKIHGHYWLDEANISRKILSRSDTLVYSRGIDNESYFKAVGKDKFQMLGTNAKVNLKFEESKMYFIESSEISEFEKYEPIEYLPAELEKFAGLYYSKELNATYELMIDDVKLIAKSPKMKEIIFDPIMKNRFTTNQWFLNRAKFEKDEKENIKGFYAGNVQVNNVWFEKIE